MQSRITGTALIMLTMSLLLPTLSLTAERDLLGHWAFDSIKDDVRIYSRALTAAEVRALCPDAPPWPRRDPRNIRAGYRIPDEGYCDQPYTVITNDGNWLCTMTTRPGREGDHGQHIVATISEDQGRTWSPPIDIEPSDGPEASWETYPVPASFGFHLHSAVGSRNSESTIDFSVLPRQ